MVVFAFSHGESKYDANETNKDHIDSSAFIVAGSEKTPIPYPVCTRGIFLWNKAIVSEFPRFC